MFHHQMNNKVNTTLHVLLKILLVEE